MSVLLLLASVCMAQSPVEREPPGAPEKIPPGYRITNMIVRGPGASTGFTHVGSNISIASGGVVYSAIDNAAPITQFTTAAVLNSTAAPKTNAVAMTYGWRPRFTSVVRTDASIANVRIFTGLHGSNNFTTSDTPSSPAAVVGFRYSTSASDTTWKVVTSDASGNVTVTDTGVAVATNTRYRLDADYSVAGVVAFKINQVAVATVSSNLPPDSSTAYYGLEIRTLDTLAKTAHFGTFTIEYNGI